MIGIEAFTAQRLAALHVSGFATAKEALGAVVDQIHELCSELVDEQRNHLADLKRRRASKGEQLQALEIFKRLESAKQTVPATIGTQAGLILREGATNEQTENAIFLLARMADDILQIGALHMVGRSIDQLPRAVTASEAGSKGGVASNVFKSGQVAAWHAKARPIIEEILKKHPDLSGEAAAGQVIDAARQQRLSFPSSIRTVAPYVRKMMAEMKQVAPVIVGDSQKPGA